MVRFAGPSVESASSRAPRVVSASASSPAPSCACASASSIVAIIALDRECVLSRSDRLGVVASIEQALSSGKETRGLDAALRLLRCWRETYRP